ncbi:MAG: HAD family phosphatase [Clostridiaceae bacterium]
MIQNIIFDMGGVLIQFDRVYFIRRLGVAAEDEQSLLNEVFRSLEWARLDRGSITESKAIANMCEHLPQRLHRAAADLVTKWDQPIIPMPGMTELVEELKLKGYGIYLLSNATLRQREYWPRVPASRFFDGTLISADVKLVKPQPEIYALLCKTFGLAASECFMIDDVAQNIEGAFEAGLSGFVFNEDVTTLKNALRIAGVEL